MATTTPPDMPVPNTASSRNSYFSAKASSAVQSRLKRICAPTCTASSTPDVEPEATDWPPDAAFGKPWAPSLRASDDGDGLELGSVMKVALLAPPPKLCELPDSCRTSTEDLDLSPKVWCSINFVAHAALTSARRLWSPSNSHRMSLGSGPFVSTRMYLKSMAPCFSASTVPHQIGYVVESKMTQSATDHFPHGPDPQTPTCCPGLVSHSTRNSNIASRGGTFSRARTRGPGDGVATTN
mmetsp:Transcript_69026/g.223871  ORF Transcript_69026/g.223871 Transcript_69026/m.223871 type:complete len:239 (-) Transcript_69026:27-743(-)